MKVLFLTWELDPFIKLGGLGDVSRSLPTALSQQGIDIRIAIPYYTVLKLGRNKRVRLKKIKVKYADKLESVEIFRVFLPGGKVPVYLIKNPTYLAISDRTNSYAFFDKAILEVIKQNALSWEPEIVHCNDHHTGLVPLLIRENHLPIKTILTIHNLSYQGSIGLDALLKMGIDVSKCPALGWEIKSKRVNFLMEGIIHADVVTTVSPTYAREIMKEEFGMGLDEILRAKEGRVFGILNGINKDFNQPKNTKGIRYAYSGSARDIKQDTSSKLLSWKEGKKLNKLFLQKKLGLKVSESIPLLSFVGRFDPHQKGIEIIHKMMRRVDGVGFQLVILGSGNVEWEERYLWLSTFYPKNISCTFAFDQHLADQIYASSDFILIPSQFEPCGLVQMMAMAFGTIPIAHKTGGLADSIVNDINGFLFDSYSSEVLERTVKKAIDIWFNDKNRYRLMVEAAFATDFSWDKSAGQYIDLYNKLINNTL